MKKRLCVVLLAMCCRVFGTAYTGSVSGNWNSAATWGGVGVPVSGDTVTINDAVTVTVPSGFGAVAGTSPADDTGTPAIQCASSTGTGVLVVASGGTLALKGPVRQCKATWTVNSGGTVSCQNLGGCTVVFDSSGAASPASANYSWTIGMASCAASPCALLVMNGSKGSRVNVGIAAGGGNFGGFRCATGTTCNNGGGVIQGGYVNIDSCGASATVRCWDAYPYVAGQDFHCSPCTLTNAAPIRVYAARNSVTFSLKNVTARSHQGALLGLEIFTGSQPSSSPTGSTYECVHCYIDGPTRALTGGSFANGDIGWKFNEAVLVGNAGGTAASDPPIYNSSTDPAIATGNWDLVMLVNQGNASVTSTAFTGTLYRTMLMAQANQTNVHFIGSMRYPTTYDGYIVERQFDDPTQRNASDAFQTIKETSAQFAITLKNGIFVPTPGGQSPATVFNHSAATDCDNATSGKWCPQASITQNTYWGDDTGNTVAGVGGENNNPPAGTILHVNSNIVGRVASGAGWILHWLSTNTPASGAFQDCDYNVYFNLSPSGVANRYLNSGTAQYSTTPGGNDLAANPNFVNTTRNFLNWGKGLKASVANWTDVLAELAKINDDSGYDPRFTLGAYYNFVRGGFRPTNGIIRAAGEGGIRPGAVGMNYSFEISHGVDAVFRPAMVNGGQ